MPEVVVTMETLSMGDISNYIRFEHKHSRKRADYLARHVKICLQHSAELLPTGWHDVLHPPKVSYVRKMPWSPFEFGSGPREFKNEKNVLGAQSPNRCPEDVHTKSHVRK